MANVDYEIRKDGKSYMFTAESESGLLNADVILEDYPYIYKSMYKEDYHLKNFLCWVFNEIVFEDKVVGFATYDVIDNFEMVLTECYILPEFRGKRLFFDEICKMHTISPKFGILQPTRNVIELLLRYAFAKNETEDIVVSAIDLFLDPLDVRSNKRKGMLNLMVPASNFYDLSICSTILVHDNEVFFHDLLENDRLMGHKRKKLKKGYFVHIRNLFSKNMANFKNMIAELKKELPENNLGYEVIVGYGDGLSDYMQAMVNRGVISEQRAFQIRNQLISEYESGQINDDSIEERCDLLVCTIELSTDNYSQFRKELDCLDDVSDEIHSMKQLFNVIGDDEKVGRDVLNAIKERNAEKLNDILINNVEFEDLIDMDREFDYYAHKNSHRTFVKQEIENKYRLDGDMQVTADLTIPDKDLYMILDRLNRGRNYYEALTSVEFDCLASPESLTDCLMEFQFIQKDGICEVDWINDDIILPKDDLKAMLIENNLSHEGNKKDLLKRLAENDITLGDDYKITAKGKDFLKEHPVMAFYWEFFDEFNFEDYSRYLESHEGSIKEASLDYTEEHLKLARKSGDEEYIEDCICSKEDIMEFGDELLRELENIQ